MDNIFNALTATVLFAGATVEVGANLIYKKILTNDGIKDTDLRMVGIHKEFEKVYSNSFIQNGKKWYDEHENTVVYVTSSVGDTITADIYMNENETDLWVICCHGYKSVPRDFGGVAEEFEKMGCNVLFPHLRGHGRSECKFVGMGWSDRLDVIRWIDYINENYPNAQIILYGVSMGASCVMMTTGEQLPDNVICAVEDCGYTSVWDILQYQMKERYKIPAFPILNRVLQVYKRKTGFDLKEASALNQVKKSNTPTLFIHGENDTFVPCYMMRMVFEAASCEKEKYIVHGAGHAGSMLTAGEGYFERINSFVKKYIKQPE